jgi:galactokinase
MIGEIAIVMCNTGIRHELVAGEYNELRRQCEAAAQALGVKSLRAVDPRYLAANKAKLTERQWQCAYHIAGEIQRVIFGSRALREGDFEQFGQYLFQSHESSRDFFKNSTPELDLLVELAKSHPGCLGARLTGGGFGGATINLVRRDQVDDFMRALAVEYEQRTGRHTTPLLCQIVDGAR